MPSFIFNSGSRAVTTIVINLAKSKAESNSSLGTVWAFSGATRVLEATCATEDPLSFSVFK